MEKALFLLVLHVFLLTGHCNDYCEHGTLRLVNGGATYRGRLEICINFVWGTACDNSFDTNDAKVACRQLGYEVDGGQTVSYHYNAAYGQGTGPIWLNYLHCYGNENTLLDCTKSYPIGNPSGCSHHDDVSITCPVNSCTTGTVRLTDGLVPTEGTVEVCYNGAWTIVCQDSWGYQEAFVVCRQLGLPSTEATVQYYLNSFGHGHGIPTLYDWRCIGNETSIMDCYKRTTSSCFNSYYGVYRKPGVRCNGQLLSDTCATGSMRLVGPNGPNDVEGRVEYCSNGVWGTITYFGFDVRDAHVVCRRLGYQQPRALIYKNTYTYGQEPGLIFYTHLSCTGSEFRIEDCTSGSYPYHYSHYDTGLKCLERVSSSCTNGSVRLVNGSSANEGRVEVCSNGEWGSVCGYFFDRREAGIVCQQLGYGSSEASVYQYSKFGDGNYQQILWNIQCTGSESNLLSCTNSYHEYCYHGHTAGVRCYNPTNCSHGDVRLYGGQSNNEGDVQICYNGVWVFVCNYNYYWYQPPLSSVICKKLGYSNNWIGYSYYFQVSIFGGSQDIAPIVRDYYSCTGNELTITQCSNSSSSSICSSTPYQVYCADFVNCTNGTVRLTGSGLVDNEGRVEICIDGIWMNIEANYYWSYNRARVVCRQLGYHDTWSVAITDRSWNGKNERFGYRYNCVGTEDSLDSCPYSTPSHSPYMYYWYSTDIRGGVECQTNGTENLCFEEGAVRLSNGSSSREGRVEVCLNGYWGSICSSGWSETDAAVVCRQAGYDTLRAFPMYNGHFGKGIGPVHMTHVTCTGHEKNISQCSYTNGIGVTNCYHGKDAGVICSESAVYYDAQVIMLNSSVTVHVDSQVSLNCSVTPSPPVGTTYHWTSTVPSTSSLFRQFSTLDSNATLTVPVIHPNNGNYYCIVKYNGVTIGRGHIVIPVQGLIYSTNVNQPSMTSGTNATLSITTSSAIDSLRELNWYYNGQKISNSNKYIISNDNKTLVIANITGEDEGEYTVQYDGLRLYHYNRECEQKLIQLLRHYPVLKPTVFKLTLNGITVLDSHTTDDINMVSFIKDSPETILTSYWTNHYNTEGSLSLYHNGVGVVSGVTSGILESTNNPHHNYTINNPQVTDAGYYELQFVIRPSTLLSPLDCPSAYQNNFLSSSRNIIIVDSIVQRLEYYEMPEVNFTSSQSSFYSTTNSQLLCSVSGGYPLYRNITIVKNGVTVVSTVGSSQLEYSTHGGRQFGLYQCIVDNRAIKLVNQVKLKEKAQLNDIYLQVSNCNDWNNKTLFETAFRNRSKMLCDCSLNDLEFSDTSLSCSNNILSLSSIITYASEDGSRTATDVALHLQHDLSINSLQINDVTALASSVAPPCPTCDSNVSVIAGVGVGGFVVAIILMTILFVIICVITQRYNKKSDPNEEPNTGNESVRYNSNQNNVVLSSRPKPRVSTAADPPYTKPPSLPPHKANQNKMPLPSPPPQPQQPPPKIGQSQQPASKIGQSQHPPKIGQPHKPSPKIGQSQYAPPKIGQSPHRIPPTVGQSEVPPPLPPPRTPKKPHEVQQYDYEDMEQPQCDYEEVEEQVDYEEVR